MLFDLHRIGRGLPAAALLGELGSILTTGAGVVQGPPGSGKTTLIPPALAAALPGRVLVTAPRRVVVRAAYRRLVELSSPDLVGYTIRGDQRVPTTARVEFVTPGVLLRRMIADPELPGVAAVVLDEVHERNLDTDLAFGMLLEVRQLRADLTVVAMSATVDADLFSSLLGERDDPAPVLRATGATHPLQVRYAAPGGLALDARGVTPEFLRHVAVQTDLAHREMSSSNPAADALVFLPGVREVSAVARELRERLPECEVLELHGSVSARDQDRAVAGRAPGDAARIVVSTSLAESALTIPGVRLVVDSGLARQPRRDAGRGLHGLVTVTESRAAADQRAGRAAREAPGVVVRCFESARYQQLGAQAPPEIATADLTAAALLLAAWGTPGGDGIPLPTPPPRVSMADAQRALRQLQAVDQQGRPTRLGRELAMLPLDPHLGRALLSGAELIGSRAAGEVVALLAEQPRALDLAEVLRQWRSGHSRAYRGSDPAAARNWAVQARRLAALAQRATRPATTESVVAHHQLGLLTALAFPHWIARLDGDSYKLVSGTRAGLPAGSGLSGQEWLAIADVTRAEGRATVGTGAVIRSAVAIDADLACRAAADLLTEQIETTFVDGRVSARRVRRLGRLELSSVAVRPTPEQARPGVEKALRTTGLALFGGDRPAADQLRRRLGLLHRVLGDPWPAMDDSSLLADLGWLDPELDVLAGGTHAGRLDLSAALRRLLPWPAASRLAHLAPERLPVPSGKTARIDYPDWTDLTSAPVVAVKLQECFGLSQTPRLVDDRVPVVFHLLSPAGRTLAVTDDLASFWSGPYQQVRAEMRGRYPKHPWPEDPWTATATARTTARGSAREGGA